MGCSNGGRQALMEAQRYPDDYDGIVAGAPANYWTHLTTQGAWISKITTAEAANYIPASKLAAVQAASLAACDALDGVKDGVIDDPRKCSFDPASIVCKGPGDGELLTSAQAATLRRNLRGPHDSKGNLIYPGLVPGDETGVMGWRLWVSGSAPGTGLMYIITAQFFRSMLFEDQAGRWRVSTSTATRSSPIRSSRRSSTRPTRISPRSSAAEAS